MGPYGVTETDPRMMGPMARGAQSCPHWAAQPGDPAPGAASVGREPRPRTPRPQPPSPALSLRLHKGGGFEIPVPLPNDKKKKKEIYQVTS